MAVTLDSFSLLSPNPNPNPNRSSGSSLFSPSPVSLRFDPLYRPRSFRVCCRPAGVYLSALHSRSLSNRTFVAFTASHEESHSEIEVEKEKDNAKLGVDDSQQAWREALDSFKEQALKIQGISQEAYEIYSKKALVVLKETSEQLTIQAERARKDLDEIAKEISEDGKVYLSTAAEKFPEVKEIVETVTSPTDDLSDVSRIHDFRVGIPYGLVLSLGGFLSFMVTGSTAGIRFGVILGGTLLALSVLSLRSHKRGEQSTLALKGQAAIAGIIFLREIRLLAQRSSIINVLTTAVSGAVLAFYIYRITRDGKQGGGSHLGDKAES